MKVTAVLHPVFTLLYCSIRVRKFLLKKGASSIKALEEKVFHKAMTLKHTITYVFAFELQFF